MPPVGARKSELVERARGLELSIAKREAAVSALQPR
jgi:hypothetical protein